jgi:hypothetical protein
MLETEDTSSTSVCIYDWCRCEGRYLAPYFTDVLPLVWQEEIEKKTGYIVMRAEGIYDVDANTSIDQLSEDLNVKMPEV